ncbi:unnamed protein product [Rhizophagus irregularis]|nr:unnamed protein product [Rhizophagus irregularis]
MATRGYSLVQDFGSLINNPKYSDIEILCEDGKKLYGCRAILAARSDVLNGLLYNGMRESYENQISFPTINSVGMEIILEYVYTGSVKEESLNQNNIIEAYYAADYFQLLDLQSIIIKMVQNFIEKDNKENQKNFSPELLSKVAEIVPSLAENDDALIKLLFEAVATTPLNTIEFGRLSFSALHHLLFHIHGKDKSFATPEYEVLRYGAILAAEKVNNNNYIALIGCLPTLKQIEEESVDMNKTFVISCKNISKELKPLIKYIDFRRIEGQILVEIIEPLKIISEDIIINALRYIKSNNPDLYYIRGIPSFYKSAYVWDKCGSKLVIEDNGRVVRAQDDINSFQAATTKWGIESEGIYEWNVIVEKTNDNICIGFGGLSKSQENKFMLRSDGICNGSINLSYCPSFKDGTKITVHLDTNKETYAFTVDGIKYPKVPNWRNFPDIIYPMVMLRSPCRLRIEEFW